MRKYSTKEVRAMVTLLKRALDTGRCRQSNAFDRACLATESRRIADDIAKAFPEMTRWYSGRLYGPGDPEDIAEEAETRALLDSVR
jgi:hypothetical protein